jgi:Mrp family chromosome partitioning ATPase
MAVEHAAARVVRGSPDTALSAVSVRPAVADVARSGDRPQHAASEKRPLSSFIPQTQPVEVACEGEQRDFQPGTTIASFQWPSVCRILMQQSSVQLDNVVRLLMARAGGGNSLIGVLGLFPKIGATTTALCLASRAAARGRRVILGDANFRSPRLASLVDAVPTAGWEEVLKHTAPLSDAVIHATNENLDLLALGSRLVKDPQPMVGGLQAAVTAGVLRHAYELAILDVGAFFDPISQPVLLELVSNLGVDAVVAIAGPGPADRRDVATIVEHLDRSGCELLGVIENRVAKPKAA